MHRHVRLFLPLLFALVAVSLNAMAATAIVTQSIQSDHLGRDLEFTVFDPIAEFDDADVQPTALLLLHGYGGGAKDWLKAGKAGRILTKSLKASTTQPLILVMPDAGNSWYIDNRAGHGNFASALLDDLIPAIEQDYLERNRPIQNWAVAGLSMGGYGALHLGFLRPERFSWIGALSPAIFEPGASFSQGQLKLFNSAYSTPFDRALYERTNPFTLLDNIRPPPVYLAVGDDDYFHLEIGTFAMFQKLREHGHPVELRITDGGHLWPFWQSEFEAMLETMTGAER